MLPGTQPFMCKSDTRFEAGVRSVVEGYGVREASVVLRVVCR